MGAAMETWASVVRVQRKVYKRPPLVSAFSNERSWKKNFTFLEKGGKQSVECVSQLLRR